jgi:hypothetical protein
LPQRSHAASYGEAPRRSAPASERAKAGGVRGSDVTLHADPVGSDLDLLMSWKIEI